MKNLLSQLETPEDFKEYILSLSPEREKNKTKIQSIIGESKIDDETLMQLNELLTTLQDQILFDQQTGGYNYHDIEKKLLISDEEVLKTFFMFLEKNDEIKKVFYAIIELLGISNIQNNTFLLHPLFRKFFEDIVYESTLMQEYNTSHIPWTDVQNNVMWKIEKIKKQKGKKLFLQRCNIGDKVKKERILEVFNQLKNSGIKVLVLDKNPMIEFFWIDGFKESVWNAWKNGIKFISLWEMNVWKYVLEEFIPDVLSVIWKSWIIAVKLNGNDMGKYLWLSGMLSVVEFWWWNGIKYFNFWENKLSQYLWWDGMTQLIQAGWDYGVKFFDFHYNQIWEYASWKDLYDMVETAGKYGISMNLWANSLVKILNTYDKLEKFIQFAHAKQIPFLNISLNGFENMLTWEQVKTLKILCNNCPCVNMGEIFSTEWFIGHDNWKKDYMKISYQKDR